MSAHWRQIDVVLGFVPDPQPTRIQIEFEWVATVHECTLHFRLAKVRCIYAPQSATFL